VDNQLNLLIFLTAKGSFAYNTISKVLLSPLLCKKEKEFIYRYKLLINHKKGENKNEKNLSA